VLRPALVNYFRGGSRLRRGASPTRRKPKRLQLVALKAADEFKVIRNVKGGTRCAELAETLGDCVGEDSVARRVLQRRGGPGSRSVRCGDGCRVAAPSGICPSWR